MSGIAIVYDPLKRQGEIEALVPRLCHALQRSDREGPVEWYGGPGLGIGRCQPAVVNRASQPAWNEGKTVCAFFHGELFGCQDLGRSMEREGHQFSDDSHAEFVVHLYEDRGDAFVNELNGSFALALWDTHRQRLIIANDRYGLCPLYAARSDGRFLWASSPKAILADTTFSRRINLVAMADFLCLGFPQGNDTMFDGIDELPPAILTICQNGQVHRQQYWDLSFQEEETGIPTDDYLDELILLLQQAAERRQMGELSTGLLLSGGLDSRVVLSTLRRDDIKVFTFGTPFCDDVRFASQAAKAVNVPHFVLEIQPDYLETFARIGIERTEDLINCSQFHGISVYDDIASRVNALITGSAGEDIFGESGKDPRGEFWGSAFSVDRLYDSRSAMTDEELEQLVRPIFFQHMRGLARSRFRSEFEKYPSRHASHRENYWSIKQLQRRRSNRLSSLFPDNLQFRPLFYDNDLVDFAQAIPPSLRWGEKALYRQVVLRVAPELAKVLATTTKGLPLTATHKQVAQRACRRQSLRRWRRRLNRISLGLVPPMGTRFFVDYATWLRRELRDWMVSMLLDPQTLNRGYWNAAGITRLVEDHLRGRRRMKYPARKITALISFELWCRTYLDTPVVKDDRGVV